MARKPLPYYPLYVYDFDEHPKVLAMSIAEVGLYSLALNEAWKRGSIPDDPKLLAVAIKRDFKDVRKAWPAVRACWVPSGEPGRLTNPRQEKERVKALDKSGKASVAAGVRYANVRTRASGHSDASADASAGAVPRASESVSVSSEVFETTTTNLRTASTRERLDLTPKKIQIPDAGPTFTRMINAFFAAGCKLSEYDIAAAANGDKENVGFIQYSAEEQMEIALAAEDLAKTVSARTMGLPVNFIGKQRWRRRGPGRVIPEARSMTRSEQASAEAKRQFMESK